MRTLRTALDELAAEGGRRRCCVCARPPEPGRPLYRTNGGGSEIGPLWCCRTHYIAVMLRQPTEQTERLEA
jgi:hypothetical protein